MELSWRRCRVVDASQRVDAAGCELLQFGPFLRHAGRHLTTWAAAVVPVRVGEAQKAAQIGPQLLHQFTLGLAEIELSGEYRRENVELLLRLGRQLAGAARLEIHLETPAGVTEPPETRKSNKTNRTT